MAITNLPPELHIIRPLSCSICRVKLLLSKATAGFHDAANQQAFACVSHFSEVDLLIRGWADFLTHERQSSLHQGKEPDDLTYMEGGINVWLD